MRGLGTIINLIAILVGGSLGVLLGHRLPDRTRQAITDGIGLMTLVIAALNIVEIANPDYVAAVGGGGAVLVVLGGIVIGGIIGSLLRLEGRLEELGGWIQARFRRSGDRDRFIDAFVSTSLIFAIGPLAFRGSIQDGMGLGTDSLVLKSVLDLFSSIAFAASLGWGVVASVIPVGIIQGIFTLIGLTAGSVLSGAVIASITVTAGILLIGIALRLLRIRMVPVADLLPAVVIAPLLTVLVAAF